MIVVRIRKDGGNGRREIGRRVRTADGEVAVNAIQQPLRDAAHGERRGGNATGSTLKSDEAEWLAQAIGSELRRRGIERRWRIALAE